MEDEVKVEEPEFDFVEEIVIESSSSECFVEEAKVEEIICNFVEEIIVESSSECFYEE